MLYIPGKTPHNLPYDPFKACIVPRPIGWISTTSPHQHEPPIHNLAPFSQFAPLTFDPPYIMFSANQTPSGTRKDTVINAESTGKFVWNLATYPLRHAVNITAEQVPYEIDEFERAGLEKDFSRLLPGDETNPVPMVKASPVRFECVYHSTMRLPGNGQAKTGMGTVDVVIGRVVGVHIADWAVNEKGRLDVKRTRPIARCGYYEYAVVGGEGQVFEMVIPGGDEATLAGLEGSTGRLEKWRGRAKGEGEAKAKL